MGQVYEVGESRSGALITAPCELRGTPHASSASTPAGARLSMACSRQAGVACAPAPCSSATASRCPPAAASASRGACAASASTTALRMLVARMLRRMRVLPPCAAARSSAGPLAMFSWCRFGCITCTWRAAVQ